MGENARTLAGCRGVWWITGQVAWRDLLATFWTLIRLKLHRWVGMLLPQFVHFIMLYILAQKKEKPNKDWIHMSPCLWCCTISVVHYFEMHPQVRVISGWPGMDRWAGGWGNMRRGELLVVETKQWVDECWLCNSFKFSSCWNFA